MPDPLAGLLKRCLRRNPEDRPPTLWEVADVIRDFYERDFNVAYPRQRSEASDDVADTLNNRALSALDLGRADTADSLWQQVSSVDSLHLKTAYNHSMYLWRAGRVTDFEVLSRIRASTPPSTEPWARDFAEALVHLERGAANAALARLERASRDGARDDEFSKTLEYARREVALGATERALQGHTGTVCAVAIAPDGHLAASGDDQGEIRVWRLDAQQCLCVLEGHSAAVESVAMSEDNRLVVSGGADQSVRVWDLGMRKCLFSLNGHSDAVRCVAMSSDGCLAVSGGGDGTLRIWDVLQRLA